MKNKISIIYQYYIIQTCLYILIHTNSIITEKSKLSDGLYKVAVFSLSLFGKSAHNVGLSLHLIFPLLTLTPHP